jgi:cytoskeletal protein RodZ
MKTVGVILREARLSKKLSFSDVEVATKIRMKFLTAIEEDDFSSMPSLSYAKGFVKNYSEFLGLDSVTVLAFFRRQIADVPKSSLLPKGMEEPLNRSAFQLTPARFVGSIVVVLVLLFLGYLANQYRSFQLPPNLSVDSPKNQQIVADSRIEVMGTTDSDATVTINGTSVLVRGDGKFFDQVALNPGVNKITVVSTSRLGKTRTVVREVGLKQP